MEEKFKLSLGAELEWSDIDRSIDIPQALGSWEGPKVGKNYLGSEIDIVNTRGSYMGVAVDPLAIKCPVGGEIHTVPSYTPESQLVRIMRILDRFPTANVACPNHGHIHVGIPGILKEENLQYLKNIFAYVQHNEGWVIKECCGLEPWDVVHINDSQVSDWVKDYMLCGDAKSIAPSVYPAVDKATSVKEILDILEQTPCNDYHIYVAGVTKKFETYCTGYSHRTAINLFNLTKMESIEFRCFRASLNPEEIYSCLQFSKMFIQEALRGVEGIPVHKLLETFNFKFPNIGWDEELALGWQNTRQSKGRSGPFKKSSGILKVTEDFLFPENKDERQEITVFDEALYDVTQLCQKSFMKQL